MDRKEYMREYQRNWIKKRRDKWIQENGPCNKCGSTLNLEVDHVDPALKLIKISTIWSRNAAVRHEELSKCQVLCESCHQEKTTQEQTTTLHGTYAMRNRDADALVLNASDMFVIPKEMA